MTSIKFIYSLFKKPKKSESHWGRTHGHKDEIIALYQSGQVLSEIGERFGVTKERIRQCLRGWDIDVKSGGESKRAEIRKLTRDKAREEKCMKRWGQTLVEHAATSQRACVLYQQAEKTRRKIWGDEWTLMLSDWLVLWEGKTDRKPAYWLTRIDDNGPWSKENVHVVPAQLVIDKREAKYKKCRAGAGKGEVT